MKIRQLLPLLVCLLLLPLVNTTQGALLNTYLVDVNGYYSTLTYKPHEHVILTSSGAFVFFMDYTNDRLYYRYVSLDGSVGSRVQITTSRIYEFSVASDGQNVIVGYSLSGGVVAYQTGTISGTAITFGSEVQPTISGFGSAFLSSVTYDSGGAWISWVVYNQSNQQQYFTASRRLSDSYTWMNEISNAIPIGQVTHKVSRNAIAYVDDDGVYVAWWTGSGFGAGTKVYSVTSTSSLVVAVQSFQRSPNTNDAILMIQMFNYDLYPSGDYTTYVLMQWTGSDWVTHSVSDGGAVEMKQAFWNGKVEYVSIGRNTPLTLTWYWRDGSWSSESSTHTSRMISGVVNANYRVVALYDYNQDDIYLIIFATAPPPPTVAFLNITVSGGGTTAPTPGTHQYQIGQNITLSALPSTGYVFAKWIINNTIEHYTSIITFALNGNTTALAMFEPAPLPPANEIYDIIENDDQEGTVPIDQEGTHAIGQVINNAINALPEPLRLPIAFTLMGLPIILILLLITGGGATVKGIKSNARRGRR